MPTHEDKGNRTMTPDNKHGGKRTGAGPKRKFDSLIRRTVTLPPEHIELLEKLGDGNLSAGIRLLVERERKTK
jgi:hypothetical protein